jgi:serine/threonine protein kinase
MLAIPPLVGHIIKGYRVVQPLAQGQASVAFRMRHTASLQTATFTALLLPETLPQEAFTTFMTRFVGLAAQLTELSHEHLLPVLDYGEYHGYPYLMTEHVDGTSVATLLKHRGRYSPESTLNVLWQVALALDYAHEHSIVHGNLRPATLLLQQDQKLQLASLGMVSLLEARGIVESIQPYAHLRNLMGTYLSDPTYLAPEYVQGRPTDARCDLYALGLLFFELLSGKAPFSGNTYLDIAFQHILGPPPSFASLCPELKFPPEFDLLLSRALAYAPEQRFGQATELVSAYEHILEQQGQTVEPHFSVTFPDQGFYPGFGQAQTLYQPEQQSETGSSLVPPGTARGKAALTEVLLAQPTQRERDFALLQQIEEYIWNENELPTLSQTEPMLLTPLGPLFTPRSQHLALSWRGIFYLALVIVVLVLSSIGIVAWSMEQRQHHSAQPAQPQENQQQQPAQSIKNIQGSQNLDEAAFILPGSLALVGYAVCRQAAAPSSFSPTMTRWSAIKQAEKARERDNPVETTCSMHSTPISRSDSYKGNTYEWRTYSTVRCKDSSAPSID